LCKHVAAVLYGIGARLDEQPELLFRLRGVDESELVAHIDAPAALAEKDLVADKVLRADDVSALFGLDMAEPAAAPPLDPGSGSGIGPGSRSEAGPESRSGTGTRKKPSRAPPPQTVAAGKTPAKPNETAKISAGRQTRPNRGAKGKVASRAMERVGGAGAKVRTPAKAAGRITRFRNPRRGGGASRRAGRS
jgi:hypothetical protein